MQRTNPDLPLSQAVMDVFHESVLQEAVNANFPRHATDQSSYKFLMKQYRTPTTPLEFAKTLPEARMMLQTRGAREEPLAVAFGNSSRTATALGCSPDLILLCSVQELMVLLASGALHRSRGHPPSSSSGPSSSSPSETGAPSSHKSGGSGAPGGTNELKKYDDDGNQHPNYHPLARDDCNDQRFPTFLGSYWSSAEEYLSAPPRIEHLTREYLDAAAIVDDSHTQFSVKKLDRVFSVCHGLPPSLYPRLLRTGKFEVLRSAMTGDLHNDHAVYFGTEKGFPLYWASMKSGFSELFT